MTFPELAPNCERVCKDSKGRLYIPGYLGAHEDEIIAAIEMAAWKDEGRRLCRKPLMDSKDQADWHHAGHMQTCWESIWRECQKGTL